MKLRLLSFLVLATLFVTVATAQKSAVFSTKDGAIKGYDPVAYFKEGKPVKGSKDFSYEWQSATWYFSSEENLVIFKERKEAYAPQFGGYCAYGMSSGKKYKIEPEAWKIVDGKLYLNYSLKIQEKWEADEASLIKEADANWKKVDQ